MSYLIKRSEGGPKGRPGKVSFCHVGYFVSDKYNAEWVRRGGGLLGRWEVGVGGVRGAWAGRGRACIGS